MTNGPKCPPECEVRLGAFEKAVEELKGMDIKQWEVFDGKIHDVEIAVTERVRTRTLIAVLGLVCTILLAILGLSFNSIKTGQEDAVSKLERVHDDVAVVQQGLTVVQTQLEERTRTADP